MDTFTAALDVLTHHGYSNALELAREIEQKSKSQRTQIEKDKQRLFDIILKYFPKYNIKRKPKYNRFGERINNDGEMRGLTMEAIDSKSRVEDLVLIRHIMMCILQRHYGPTEVGRAFGNKDHSTALHARYKVQAYCKTYKSYAQRFEEIKKAYLESF